MICIAFSNFNLTTALPTLFNICVWPVNSHTSNSKQMIYFFLNQEKEPELKQNTFIIIKGLTTCITGVGINYMSKTSYATALPVMLSEHRRTEGYSSLSQSRLPTSEKSLEFWWTFSIKPHYVVSDFISNLQFTPAFSKG